ncbi:F-box protein [Ananas comosus]|uniref:F-box protein n=1 Tax=Ananas comosus TaxID=4615 RepID=A0A199VPY1_ANACO|nr:F-box protein [Ananas comosus]
MASPPTFSDFPEDVQLNILSFLSPLEVSAFACTSRRFSSLCGGASSGTLWLAMCHRRWGSVTRPRSWSPSSSPRLLYRTLDRWENLIGFWRRVGASAAAPALVFFEWGASSIAASAVSPSPGPGSYGVLKVPFLWMGLSPRGDPLCFLLRPAGSRSESPSEPSDPDPIPVTVSFMGRNHFVVEEDRSFDADAQEEDSVESTSPPDRVMSEIYEYFANRTSPNGDKSFRRQRKRERERLGRRGRGFDTQHFVKISNYYPTLSRPLQGLWKGICEDMVLDFFLVAYDDVGGMSCRRVGEMGSQFSGYSSVFWTSNTAFIESPFPQEEQDIYISRRHIRSVASSQRNVESEVVSRILCINSSYDLVIPDLSGDSGNFRNVEGRIWEYEDKTFGFGFLRNNFIIDLKPIAMDGRILDTVDKFCDRCTL